jgi:glycosyltransferase involved in cell wall biosynthesis
MAAGCPVLTANRYGTLEIAGDAAVLVDPESVEQIASGMQRLIEDAALRDTLITAGRARMRDMTWENCARSTLRLLESLA